LSLVTLALVVAVVAVIASIVYVVLKAIELFRSVRELFRGVGAESARLGASLERLAAFEPPDVDALSDATARLQTSRARLEIQLGALRRVREQWGALLAFYPRK
jgi:hypothetical protein